MGLRSARFLNRAFMTKLAFLFFQDQAPLWVRLLQGKYFKPTVTGLALRYRQSRSAVWKGLSAEWNVMLAGSRAVIRNGRETNFWTTRWVDSGVQLLELSTRNPSEINLEESVAEFGDDMGGWDLHKLRLWLSDEGVVTVAGMAAPRDDRGDDGWAWGSENHVKFSIKSAYALITDTVRRQSEELWKVICRWKGPNRIRHFLWLAGNDRLLTNDQRTRRNFASDPMCPRCPGQVEDSIHVLRDCSFAKEVWGRTGGFDQNVPIWSGSRQDWLRSLLSSEDGLAFGVICWTLWRQRNVRIFANSNDPAGTVAIRACAWEKTVAEAMERDARATGVPPTRRRVDIAWNPGESGWWTINSDGAACLSSGSASAGGLIRDEFGHCVAAFTMNIGRCSITRAELRGAIKGLQVAWELGLSKVELQVDSSAIIQMIEEVGEPKHQHAMEVLEFRDLVARDWDVQLRHVYREGNHAADFLAGIEFSFPIGCYRIPPSDVNLGYYLRYDCISISEPRLIVEND
ncbi:Putative ribonuclease H protein At1g65750 [Linum perenne]